MIFVELNQHKIWRELA